MLFYFGILGVGVRRRFLRVSSGSKKQRSKPVIVAKSSSLGLYPSFYSKSVMASIFAQISTPGAELI